MVPSKFKIRSRFMLLTLIFLIGGLTSSWLFASHFLEIMTMDYNAPDLVGTKKEIRHNFLEQISTWETFVDASMFYVINFIPVLFILPTLGLFVEKRSLYVLGRHRYPSFKKAIYKDVMQYVLLSAVTVVVSFLIFYSIGGLFVYRSIDDIGGFSSILPENFYMNHPYLFFVFMVCTIYFSLAIVFSLLACALILLTDREYKVILLVLLIYFLYGKLGVYTESTWFDIFTSFTAFNTLYSTGETFIPLVILLIISLILLAVGVNKTVKNIEG
ncbi:hypothetical protein ACFSKI_21890 [Pseudogracilibacillus auburnensis]|uniref:ABC-2 type transport system permease protein n=1 Tax=Pseudogracilibacillus auburnensis TaxID=1494959 RepID=A0A2V3W943_9BACI|nr:hypothetical protein [Pseudogracilibacillus auburnensis]MBO1004548.1 hypothetical protein [Pseudogracilibacillus auburnensis]PXW85249.1 hypothetical protein DFR56_11115 [Pseudogracilibacillus auburnensis]